jgi:hypothetical protein
MRRPTHSTRTEAGQRPGGQTTDGTRADGRPLSETGAGSIALVALLGGVLLAASYPVAAAGAVLGAGVVYAARRYAARSGRSLDRRPAVSRRA